MAIRKIQTKKVSKEIKEEKPKDDLLDKVEVVVVKEAPKKEVEEVKEAPTEVESDSVEEKTPIKDPKEETDEEFESAVLKVEPEVDEDDNTEEEETEEVKETKKPKSTKKVKPKKEVKKTKEEKQPEEDEKESPNFLVRKNPEAYISKEDLLNNDSLTMKNTIDFIYGKIMKEERVTKKVIEDALREIAEASEEFIKQEKRVYANGFQVMPKVIPAKFFDNRNKNLKSLGEFDTFVMEHTVANLRKPVDREAYQGLLDEDNQFHVYEKDSKGEMVETKEVLDLKEYFED